MKSPNWITAGTHTLLALCLAACCCSCGGGAMAPLPGNFTSDPLVVGPTAPASSQQSPAAAYSSGTEEQSTAPATAPIGPVLPAANTATAQGTANDHADASGPATPDNQTLVTTVNPGKPDVSQQDSGDSFAIDAEALKTKPNRPIKPVIPKMRPLPTNDDNEDDEEDDDDDDNRGRDEDDDDDD